MGAFFSGTDEQQCIDGANENFYYSLVVSTKAGKELHCGVSYPDQFGQVHIVEMDDIEVEENRTFDKEWKQQATHIKKTKKPEPTSINLYQRGKYNNAGQATLFNTHQKKEEPQTSKQERYEEHIDWLSYNGSYGLNSKQEESMYDWALFDEFDDAMLAFEKGKITKPQLKKKLKKIGVDEYGRPLS
jgi:hypothetical protein